MNCRRSIPISLRNVVLSLFATWLMLSGTTGINAAPNQRGSVANQPSRTFVVAVGIDRYRDKFWPTLRFASHDARNFAAAMGGGSTPSTKTVVLENEGATQIAIRTVFDRLREKLNAADRLIVYFSGHGTLAAGGQDGELAQVLVTNDTRSEKILKTGISHDDLRRMLDRIPAQRKLLILATCHSGVGKSKLSPITQRILSSNKGRSQLKNLREEATSEGFLIFAAAARGETAREDASLKSDIYTYFFLQALRVGDRDANGQVTALEAHDYARQKTWAMTRGKQRPTIEGKAIGAFDFPLTGQRQQGGLPVLTAYENGLQGYAVQVSGGEKGLLPSGFPMKEGMNIIEVYPPDGDDPVAVYAIRATQGEKISLDDVVKPAPWTIGFDTSRSWVQDPAAKKITPKNGIVTMSLHLTWSSPSVDWPLFFGISGSRTVDFAESGGAPGINTESHVSGLSLSGGYRFVSLDGRFAKASLSLGQANLGVDFKDRRIGSTTSMQQRSSLLGLDLAGGDRIRIDGDINWLFGLRYEQTNFGFGEIGSVRMNHFGIYTGIETRLGARARRLK